MSGWRLAHKILFSPSFSWSVGAQLLGDQSGHPWARGMSACRKKGMRPKHGAPEVNISGGKSTGRSHPSSLRRSSHDCTAVPAAGLHLLTGASLQLCNTTLALLAWFQGSLPASLPVILQTRSLRGHSTVARLWGLEALLSLGFFITRLLPLPFFPVRLASPCASTCHSQVPFLVPLPWYLKL